MCRRSSFVGSVASLLLMERFVAVVASWTLVESDVRDKVQRHYAGSATAVSLSSSVCVRYA